MIPESEDPRVAAALRWCRDYFDSIDMTALRLAFLAGADWQSQRIVEGPETREADVKRVTDLLRRAARSVRDLGTTQDSVYLTSHEADYVADLIDELARASGVSTPSEDEGTR